MTDYSRMVHAHPDEVTLDRDLLARAVGTLAECADACNQCADACLTEIARADVQRCIRVNLDCADLCSVSERLLGRQSGYFFGVLPSLLDACIAACELCATECETHAARMEHCSLCARTCRRCERACRELLATIA